MGEFKWEEWRIDRMDWGMLRNMGLLRNRGLLMCCNPHLPGGYDSDVERDKQRDYTIKTYSNPIRDGIGGTKPHLQEAKPVSGEKKPAVSRNTTMTSIVACSQTSVGVKASVYTHRGQFTFIACFKECYVLAYCSYRCVLFEATLGCICAQLLLLLCAHLLLLLCLHWL